MPPRLGKLQWIELNEADSHNQILNALNIQRRKYIQNYESNKRDLLDAGIKERAIVESIQGSPGVKIEIRYPEFISNDPELLLINSIIQSYALKSYYGSKSHSTTLFEEGGYNGPRSGLLQTDNEIKMGYKIELNTKEVISISMFSYHYFSGAAHGNYGTTGFNFKLKPFKEITIENLLEYNDKAIPILINACDRELKSKLKSRDPYLLKDPYKPVWKTFSNFILSTDSIIFLFPPYALTSFAQGEHKLPASFDELIQKMPELRAIRTLRTKLAG